MNDKPPKPRELERQLRRLRARVFDNIHESDIGLFDGRPRDNGSLLDALIREHGPDGRPDLFKPSKK